MKQKIPFYGPLEATVREWAQAEHYCLYPHNSASSFHLYMEEHRPNLSVIGVNGKVLEQRVIANSTRRSDRPSIIAVTESNSEPVMSGCFTQGADRVVAVDQCTKRIFWALVNKLIPSHQDSYLPYQIHAKTQCFDFAGKQVHLGKRAFDLAQYLFFHHGKFIPKREILRDVWGSRCADLTTQRIETQICLIRQQLLLDGSHGWKIVTRRNSGYGLLRLTANTKAPSIQHNTE